jgi:hypothetical protein
MRTRTWVVGAIALTALALTTVAFAAGGPGMMGPEHRTSVPSFLGYYDGHKDTFLGPDTSSRPEAKMEHINFSAKLGASVKTTEEIYVFSGKTATG